MNRFLWPILAVALMGFLSPPMSYQQTALKTYELDSLTTFTNQALAPIDEFSNKPGVRGRHPDMDWRVPTSLTELVRQIQAASRYKRRALAFEHENPRIHPGTFVGIDPDHAEWAIVTIDGATRKFILGKFFSAIRIRWTHKKPTSARPKRSTEPNEHPTSTDKARQAIENWKGPMSYPKLAAASGVSLTTLKNSVPVRQIIEEVNRHRKDKNDERGTITAPRKTRLPIRTRLLNAVRSASGRMTQLELLASADVTHHDVAEYGLKEMIRQENARRLTEQDPRSLLILPTDPTAAVQEALRHIVGPIGPRALAKASELVPETLAKVDIERCIGAENARREIQQPPAPPVLYKPHILDPKTRLIDVIESRNLFGVIHFKSLSRMSGVGERTIQTHFDHIQKKINKQRGKGEKLQAPARAANGTRTPYRDDQVASGEFFSKILGISHDVLALAYGSLLHPDWRRVNDKYTDLFPAHELPILARKLGHVLSPAKVAMLFPASATHFALQTAALPSRAS